MPRTLSTGFVTATIGVLMLEESDRETDNLLQTWKLGAYRKGYYGILHKDDVGGCLNIMDEGSKKVFKDCLETVYMYFTYLHLGYFYSQFSKHEDLSDKAKSISIKFDTGEYLLRRDIISKSLLDMYTKSSSQDFFSYLILIDSIRGIANALVEALNDKEIKNLFLKEIFRNDEEVYKNFDGIVRFVRNTLSHNIRDRLELKNDDYRKQVNSLKGKGKSTLNFFFDYSKSPIPIERENYTVEIHIDFNKIKDGDEFSNVISEYQSIMFIELCYNCMEYLKDKLGDNHHLKSLRLN